MVVRQRLISIGLILFAATAWASSGLFVGGVLQHSEMSPISLAFWRDFYTFVLLLIVTLVWKPDRLRVGKPDLIWLALMGGLGIGLFHAIWNFSVLENGMAIATMFQYNETIIITLAAVLFFKEPLSWRKILAIFCSITGTALISGIKNLQISQVTTTGLVLGLSTALGHAMFSLFGKKLTAGYEALTVVLYAFGFGSLVLLPFQVFLYQPPVMTPEAGWHLAVLVLGPTLLSFAAFVAALRWMPVSNAAIIATSEVPLAALMAFLFLGETLGGWQILGGSLVIVGVVMVSVPARKNSGRTTAVMAES